MNNGFKLRRKIIYVIIIPIVLALALMCICIGTFGIDSKQTFFMTLLLAVYVVLVTIAYIRLRPMINATLVDYSLEQGKIQKELLRKLAVPYAILDTDGHIMWANDEFHKTVGVSPKKHINKGVDSYFPELAPNIFSSLDGKLNMDVEFGERKFNALIKRVDLSNVFDADREESKDDDIVNVMYLFDITELKALQKENQDQKLIAGLAYIDNYDETMDSLDEIKHSIITALVDRKINMYLGNVDAIVKHLENDKYLFIFPQKYLQTLKDDKFSLVDDIKSINVGNDIPMTLSIGIGAGTDSFVEAYEYARVAIGLALGRGGDQAAVKYGDQVSYFGGKSAGVEKTTRVKARVKAQAFEELLESRDKVIIMAHKRPDADAFGSAVGIYRLVTTLNHKAHIVINEVTDAIRPIISSFKGSNIYGDMIINSEQAINMVGPGTMVVVCDVNRPSMTECEELLSMVSSIVVFDHHRQTSEAIANATLSYIEPFASSACEMITEMFQYISIKPKIRPVEADAMYARILIDTDNFMTKTGVRTFDAASYLRKCGSDVTRVRKMFRTNLMEMKERAQGISNAEIYMNSFALSYVVPDPNSGDAPTVPVAKAANELLNVENIKASFVVTEAENGTLYVSARSIGDMNVQVIMEKFGGGGHATVAGVQLKDTTKEEFFAKLKEILASMYSEGEI